MVNNARLFADDTSLFVIIDNDPKIGADSLNLDLINLSSWAKDWHVSFNAQKTKSMTFTRRNAHHPDVLFDGTYVQNVEEHTHLGVTFKSNATWSSHIEKIYVKACSRINILRMLKYNVDRLSLLKIYLSFIRPIIEYACVVWNNCYQYESDLIESVQIEALRIITGLRCNSSTSFLYEELGIETLEKRRLYQRLITIFKMIRGYCPHFLKDMITPYLPFDNLYNLRNNNDLKTPLCRTTSYQNSFLPSTIKAWNNLPFFLKQLDSVSKFKAAIKRHLFTTKPCLPHFHIGARKENIVHCQLRYACSNLKHHLFTSYLSDTSHCPYCPYACEDTFHFFFQCPEYSEIRNSLIDDMRDVVPSLHIDLPFLLYGSREVDSSINCAIFRIVQKFIKESKRF